MMWDLFNEPFDIRPDGMVHAPDRAGLGFTLRADALEQFRYVDGPEFEFQQRRSAVGSDSPKQVTSSPAHTSLRDRRFESISLQQSVACEPEFSRRARCRR